MMRLFSLILYIAVLFSAPALAETEEIKYFAVIMDGKKIGHLQHTRTVENNIVTTSEKMNMTLLRMGAPMTVNTIETTVETVAGKSISFESIMDVSIMKQKATGKINAQGKMDITIETMGQSQRKTIDYPPDTLMLEGMRLLHIKKGLKEGTQFEASMFAPSLQAVVHAKIVIGPTVNVDLFGRVLPLTETTVTLSMPTGAIESIGYVDKDFNALKTVMPAMGMTLELIACDKSFALSDNDVVDFVSKMLLPSPVPLKNVNSKKGLVHYLVPIKGAKLSIPSTNNQIVKKLPDGKVMVTVIPVAAAAGVKIPYKGKDPEILQALKPTQYLQCDDKKVIDLAIHAAGSTKDAAIVAKQIESFVAGYIIEKNLSVGYATAAEVAQSRQGDCTEHAVLTAAMCRAVGIPARVVTGIAFIEDFAGHKNVFGGHAWTQAYIGDQWVGLDATRAPDGYGPAHITMASGNGDPSDFFAVANTLGYFTIEKIDVIN